MELYRDDIYTDLPDNDKLTSDLSTTKVFSYFLNYIDICFTTEKNTIGSIIPMLENYQKQVGNTFISEKLLIGVYKNLYSYFKDKGGDFENLNVKVKSIHEKMRLYATSIADLYDVQFKISNFLGKEIL